MGFSGRLVKTAPTKAWEIWTWEPTDNAKDWWTMMGTRAGVPRKGLHSLILLVVWEIWKERNARTFQKKGGVDGEPAK